MKTDADKFTIRPCSESPTQTALQSAKDCRRCKHFKFAPANMANNVRPKQSLDGFHMPKSIVQVMYRFQSNTFVQLQTTKQQPYKVITDKCSN